MQERNSLQRGASLLGILLLTLSAAAAAVEGAAVSSEKVFSLGLEETVEFGEALKPESSLAAEPGTVAAVPAANFQLGFSAAELSGSEAVLEAQAEDRVTPRSGGFGKWIKKGLAPDDIRDHHRAYKGRATYSGSRFSRAGSQLGRSRSSEMRYFR